MTGEQLPIGKISAPKIRKMNLNGVKGGSGDYIVAAKNP
jgi:hypothetical protein